MRPFLVLALAAAGCVSSANAQTAGQENVTQQIQSLTDAINRAQSQLEQSQRVLDDLRHQLSALQQQVAQGSTTTAPAIPSGATAQAAPTAQPPAYSSSTEQSATTTATALDEVRERQAMQESQIAVHEQSKIESASKFPIKLTGLILLNGFVNTNQVDVATAPTLVFPGTGSTGFTVRQTILGVDATGPHIFGARSFADLRVDFDGVAAPSSSTTNFSSSYSSVGLLRLRTAHASLQWPHTQLFFSLDRPIFSPDSPTSLAAVAEPALAWSGSLWAWNPQAGVTQDVRLGGSHLFRMELAVMDVADAPLTPRIYSLTSQLPSTAQQSRWPGGEARIALLGSSEEDASHFGLGGYISPHRGSAGQTYNAWAGTVDYRLRLPAHLDVSGSVYRGAALGGLGVGGFKDYGYQAVGAESYFIPFNDVGGWIQLKEKFNQRIELNGALGIDQVFAHQLRPFAGPASSWYQNLARNRTFTGNVIYSPSAYLLFSLEYRHLDSSPVIGATANGNVVGVAAGYKF